MAAKRRKKHKNLLSHIISICYNEKKIELLTFYESIKFTTDFKK